MSHQIWVQNIAKAKMQGALELIYKIMSFDKNPFITLNSCENN